jgi:hypothetical protein
MILTCECHISYPILDSDLIFIFANYLSLKVKIKLISALVINSKMITYHYVQE